jgi:hypothetical protein
MYEWLQMRFGLVTRFIDHLYAHNLWLHFTDHRHTKTNVLKSVIVSTSQFLATDFNTGTRRVSLNYTLQISHTGTITVSLNYTLQISHIKSSLHSQTFNWALLQLTLFFTESHTELPNNGLCSLLITSQHRSCRNTPFPTVTLLLCAYSLLQEHVYRAAAQESGLRATA